MFPLGYPQKVSGNGRNAVRIYGYSDPRYQFNSSEDEQTFKGLSSGKSLAAGQYYGDYAVVNAGDNFTPPGYQDVGSYMAPQGYSNPWSALGRIDGPYKPNLKIVKKASTAAPAAETPKPYEIDTDAIGRAKDLAAKAKDQYASSIPSLDPTRDPYSSAMAYGSGMQRSLLDGQAFFDAKAKANTTEIGEASKGALSRFLGKVEDLKDPSTYWRNYLNA